jgi:hypothetical protein
MRNIHTVTSKQLSNHSPDVTHIFKEQNKESDRREVGVSGSHNSDYEDYRVCDVTLCSLV